MKDESKKIIKFISKVILWRLISILLMVVTIHLVTGDFNLAGKVTLAVQIVQTLAHAFFEVFWKDCFEKR